METQKSQIVVDLQQTKKLMDNLQLLLSKMQTLKNNEPGKATRLFSLFRNNGIIHVNNLNIILNTLLSSPGFSGGKSKKLNIKGAGACLSSTAANDPQCVTETGELSVEEMEKRNREYKKQIKKLQQELKKYKDTTQSLLKLTPQFDDAQLLEELNKLKITKKGGNKYN